MRLPLLLLGWYGCNSFFAVWNKEVLRLYPHAWMVSWLQLVVGVFVILTTWILRPNTAPRVDGAFLVRKFGPMAALHASGHAFQVSAFGAGSVFFANVVKACEPIVGTVIGLIAGAAMPKWTTNASLVPVAVGVFVAGHKPGQQSDLLSYSSAASLFSCITFAVAKLLAKNLMTPQMTKLRNLSAATNYALLTCCSAVVLLVSLLALDWPGIVAAVSAFRLLPPDLQTTVALKIALSGTAYYLSNVCSFQVLDLTGPVTQAVANAAKRVFVLAAAVVFLGDQLTFKKTLGSTIALSGVLFYGLSKAKKPKKEKAR